MFIKPEKILAEKNGVYILSEPSIFESIYLKIRAKEQRIYSDQLLSNLPSIASNHIHYKEWEMRKSSTQRFLDYLKVQPKSSTILDLGSGNGWFSNHLAQVSKQNYISAVDMNLNELEQGAKVFKSENLRFYYANIFESIFPLAAFDLIIINSAVQYFENLAVIINRLLTLLKPNGTIHILDSPFYSKSGAIAAKDRSLNYFTSMGYPQMAAHYHHHHWEALSDFSYSLKYDPSKKVNRLKKWIGRKDVPFPWIEIRPKS